MAEFGLRCAKTRCVVLECSRQYQNDRSPTIILTARERVNSPKKGQVSGMRFFEKKGIWNGDKRVINHISGRRKPEAASKQACQMSSMSFIAFNYYARGGKNKKKPFKCCTVVLSNLQWDTSRRNKRMLLDCTYRPRNRSWKQVRAQSTPRDM